jgi:hypothetical protein
MKHSPAKAQRRKALLLVFLCALAPLRETLPVSSAQTQPPPPPATLGLEHGYLDLDTPDFKLRLVKASQMIAALEPKSAPGLDFTPADRLSQREADRYHHLGDLILRVRAGGSGPWQKYDTADSRKPVEPLSCALHFLRRTNSRRTLDFACNNRRRSQASEPTRRDTVLLRNATLSRSRLDLRPRRSSSFRVDEPQSTSLKCAILSRVGGNRVVS